jgi:leucyl-tRNA synthetase
MLNNNSSIILEIEPKKFIHKTTNEPVESFDSKMSKSKNNGIDPIKEIEMYGVDLTRLQILGAAAPRAHFVWGTSQKTGI